MLGERRWTKNAFKLSDDDFQWLVNLSGENIKIFGNLVKSELGWKKKYTKRRRWTWIGPDGYTTNNVKAARALQLEHGIDWAADLDLI